MNIEETMTSKFVVDLYTRLDNLGIESGSMAAGVLMRCSASKHDLMPI
jgi:hypothetical protein